MYLYEVGCDLLAYLVPKILLIAPPRETANKQSVRGAGFILGISTVAVLSSM